MMRFHTLCSVALAGVVVAAAPARPARAQAGPMLRPPGRAFEPAVALLLGFSNFGDRATSTRSGGDTTIAHALSRGPVLGVRLQSPLTRRLGLMVGATAARRNRKWGLEGRPDIITHDRVTVLRAEAGLLFRFKPAAPVFFGGAYAYQRNSPGVVQFQDSGRTTEQGFAFGVGYDFERRRQRDLSARLEYWWYFMQPGDQPLSGGYVKKSMVRDWALSLALRYRIRPPRPRSPAGR